MSATKQNPISRRASRPPIPVLVLWLLIAASVVTAVVVIPSAWDVNVYRTALRSLRAGHDPYLDAMAIQRIYHQQTVHPAGDPPFSYVYSPITLPLLHIVNAFPGWLSGTVYWSAYVLAVLAEIWVGLLAVQRQERRLFLYLAPLTIFFPGGLANGIVLGGNVVYILYAAILLAAALGWRRDIWRWFYLAVLIASCVKAPLLSLVVIPLFSARKQWVPAVTTAVSGVAIFAGTPLIWPALFRHYLQAVELQFSFNHDFGCSPAGLFSDALVHHGMAYSPAGLLFFAGYAIPVLAILFYLSRRFVAGAFPLQQWLPVLLVGVLLLNPRLLEYDVFPLALPLALILWRSLAVLRRRAQAATAMAVFLIGNGLALRNWESWKLTEGTIIVLCFSIGCWRLLDISKVSSAARSAAQPLALTS